MVKKKNYGEKHNNLQINHKKTVEFWLMNVQIITENMKNPCFCESVSVWENKVIFLRVGFI